MGAYLWILLSLFQSGPGSTAGPAPSQPLQVVKTDFTSGAYIFNQWSPSWAKITVRNVSGRAVKEFDWELVVYERRRDYEYDRLRFRYEKRIKPGEEKSHTKSIEDLDPPPEATYRIYTTRVVFEDGGVWERKMVK